MAAKQQRSSMLSAHHHDFMSLKTQFVTSFPSEVSACFPGIALQLEHAPGKRVQGPFLQGSPNSHPPPAAERSAQSWAKRAKPLCITVPMLYVAKPLTSPGPLILTVQVLVIASIFIFSLLLICPVNLKR